MYIIIYLSGFAMYENRMVSYIYKKKTRHFTLRHHETDSVRVLESLPTKTLRASKTVSSGIGVGGSCNS